MNPLRTPERGETIKLGPPAAGDVVITVDPSSAGTTFAAGLQTFLPGAQLPVHRHRDRDLVLFVSKGQGRLTLEGRIVNVVPGAMVHVPRNTWISVRNTGTGVLQIAWASSPGLETWFRALGQLGSAASPAAFHELGQRHNVEFREPGAPSAPRRRRRRRGGGRRSAPPAGQPSGGTPRVASPPPTVKTPPSGPGRPRSSRPHHRRRVKEVYMGGRWVKVEGEGPVIAPGRSSEHRAPKPGEDDEPPPIRLSVPL